MKRRLNARLWSVLLGLAMAVLAPVGALAEYVPSAADCFWASHEAAAYELSTEDVVWMLENGKTRSEIETALCNARPLPQYATGAAEYLDLARKWNVPSGEAIDAYKIGLEIGADPEAYLYAVAQGRSPEEAQAALRRYVGARKAVQSLGVLGNVEIPGDIEIEDVRNTNASGVPRGDAGPAAWVIRPMTVGSYSARSSSTVGALAAGGSAVWCTLEDRRSAVAHAIASVYSLPARDNPEGFVLERLRKGLSIEEALSVMFTLDCAWAGESGFASTPWSPDVLSLPSDQLMSEAGEMADTISLARSWKVEPIPYEARLELRDQGFLRPEAVGSPPAPIEPEADLGPLASGTGDPSIVDPGALYDCGKVSPFNRYLEGFSEMIDPKTGVLIVKQKDLAFPGRNGFDLVVERVYCSREAAAGKPMVSVRVAYESASGSRCYAGESDAFSIQGVICKCRHNGTIDWVTQPCVGPRISAHFVGQVDLMRYDAAADEWDYVDGGQCECEILVSIPEGSLRTTSTRGVAWLDTEATYLDHKYGIGLGWALAFPSVEIQPDAELLHLGDGTVFKIGRRGATHSLVRSGLVGHDTLDLVFSETSAVHSRAGSGASYCLAAKDGTNSYFASDGRLLWTADRFGNTIMFWYQTVGKWRRICRIEDSVGRTIQFAYNTSSVTMSTEGKTWVYELQPSASIGGKSILRSVTDPCQRKVQYQYRLCPASFGVSADYPDTCDNWYANLNRITHPAGGSSSYAYDQTTKNMTNEDPRGTDECTMTVFRVSDRSDRLGEQSVTNLSRFSYFCEWTPGTDVWLYGADRSALPDATEECTRPLTEKWTYASKHLLASHSLEDVSSGETRRTVYQYNGARMVVQEDTKVLRSNSPGVAVTSMKYEWDAYANLRSAKNQLTGAETRYEYDPRYHLVVCTAEKANAWQGSLDGWRYTIGVLDDTGRKAVSSSQSMQKPLWEAKPALTVLVGRELLDVGDEWTSWTIGPVGSAQLDISWRRGGLQVVGYEVSYRRTEDSGWTCVASLLHGWSAPKSGSDTVSISFSEPGVYSVRVRMDSGILRSTCATVASMTEQPYERVFPAQALAKSIVNLDYEDPGYPGNLTRRIVVQPDGHDEVTSFAYDDLTSHAYPVSVSTRVTAADGAESTVSTRARYDSFGQVTEYTTSSGVPSSTTTFIYDGVGRLMKATYPAVGGSVASREWRWNDEARTVTRIDEEGRSLIEQYDQLGRFVELRRPAALPNMTETAVTKVGYNSLGNVAYEEDAAGRRVLYEYDGFGRRIKTVYPDGNFGTTSFEACRSDPSGAVSVETVTDALGRCTKTYLDAAGRKVRVEQEAEDGLSAATRFEYDLLGRIT